jgi:alanine-synthesizing transaminase
VQERHRSRKCCSGTRCLSYLETVFSSRVPADLSENRLTRAFAALAARGEHVLDLTETNPTKVGLPLSDDLLEPLANGASLVYEPQPLGLPRARLEVSRDFARRGLDVPPERVALTASTSEAYSLLFKLLCNPGDRVLVPQPSYPLFDHLTRLDGIEAASYRIEFHGGWLVDLDSVHWAVSPRTRAILAVSPNNPTGSFLSRDEIAALSRIAQAHDLALIGDEVFADYVIDAGHEQPPSVLADPAVLTFGLGGLSKSAGLPQLKLGWVGMGGPEPLVVDARARLELIADTYLSVSTPVQHALPALLATGAEIRARILERVRANYRHLSAASAACPSCTLLPADGGWSAVLRVPATLTEEALVLALLERDCVLVHPGYFFDFAREAFLVVSLLPEPGVFREGVRCMLARVSVPPDDTSA